MVHNVAVMETRTAKYDHVVKGTSFLSRFPSIHTLSSVPPPFHSCENVLAGLGTFWLAAAGREEEERLTDSSALLKFLEITDLLLASVPTNIQTSSPLSPPNTYPSRAEQLWDLKKKKKVIESSSFTAEKLVRKRTDMLNSYFFFSRVQMLRSVAVLLLLAAAVSNAEVSSAKNGLFFTLKLSWL